MPVAEEASDFHETLFIWRKARMAMKIPCMSLLAYSAEVYSHKIYEIGKDSYVRPLSTPAIVVWKAIDVLIYP